VRRVDSLVLQDVGGEAILVPIGAKVVDLNGLVTLNATGRCLWVALAENQTVDSLVDALCADFDVTPEQARADIGAFLADLDRLQALER